MRWLQATVRKVTGNTRHLVVDGDEVHGIPDAAVLEIHATTDAFLLLRLDQSGQEIADTWHQTLEQPKAQATFEYEVVATDWIDMRH